MAHSLSPDHCSLLRSLVEKSSLASASKALGVSPETVARALAGLGIRAGSAELIGNRLSRIATNVADQA